MVEFCSLEASYFEGKLNVLPSRVISYSDDSLIVVEDSRTFSLISPLIIIGQYRGAGTHFILRPNITHEFLDAESAVTFCETFGPITQKLYVVS